MDYLPEKRHLHSQSIDFTNAFSQADIPSGEPVFIELPRYFKSDGRQYDLVIRLKKILYGKAEAAHLWYEKLRNGYYTVNANTVKYDTVN